MLGDGSRRPAKTLRLAGYHNGGNVALQRLYGLHFYSTAC